jgi:hypothetical protein
MPNRAANLVHRPLGPARPISPTARAHRGSQGGRDRMAHATTTATETATATETVGHVPVVHAPVGRNRAVVAILLRDACKGPW